ncbi:helix-turn-helix domain-containing protein [Streptomyces sp. DSM 41033]|uniref:helix-turn-helix domain-containing protein n=1 Tax=Streptomyces sp. DSM 41033 TaxID=3448655 RepID=UPI00403FCD97
MRTVGPSWDSPQVGRLASARDLGGLIRLGRGQLGWRQADLGRRIGCSASTVSRLEQRGSRADLQLLKQACSPRVRGWPHPLHAVRRARDLLPARAGMAPATRPGPSSPSAAPRARGWPQAPARLSLVGPLLPARAGMVPAATRL